MPEENRSRFLWRLYNRNDYRRSTVQSATKVFEAHRPVLLDLRYCQYGKWGFLKSEKMFIFQFRAPFTVVRQKVNNDLHFHLGFQVVTGFVGRFGFV